MSAETPRQIAVVRNYDEFKNALRARADELQLSRDTIDAFGLPKGHAGHLLAPVPIKHIGPQSFGVLLTALGLKVLVVEDAEAFAIYAADAPKSRNASVRMLPKKKRQNKHNRAGDVQWSQIMNARRALVVSDQKRRQIATQAAKARWRKPRIVEIAIPKRASRKKHPGYVTEFPDFDTSESVPRPQCDRPVQRRRHNPVKPQSTPKPQ